MKILHKDIVVVTMPTLLAAPTVAAGMGQAAGVPDCW
jgi:hypothetical protein